MVRDVDVTKASKKRKDRISVADADFRLGIADPKRDWLTEFVGAKDRRNAELRKAMDEGRFEKGATAVGTEGWKRATTEKADRWLTGAVGAQAVSTYETQMREVADCIKRAREAIKGMASVTLEQRAERSKQYQINMSKCIEEKKRAGKLV